LHQKHKAGRTKESESWMEREKPTQKPKEKKLKIRGGEGRGWWHLAKLKVQTKKQRNPLTLEKEPLTLSKKNQNLGKK
jgi:hypothetical protein